ncbi:VWA domain-containing protein [bacterium]|nr:VWA domain-containing protein [bacterium]
MHRSIIMILIFLATAIFPIAIIFPPNAGPGEKISISELPVEPIEANIDIKIFENYATISLIEIFRNPRKWNQEGILKFTLPEGMEVSGFATWDGPQRISGVIMEKRRAVKIYDELCARAIDPGILLPSSANIFTAKIVPIYKFATKRVEIVCGRMLPEIDDKVFFNLPLAPENIRDEISLKRLKISVELLGRANFKKLSISGIEIPLERNDSTAKGEISLKDFSLPPALTIEYEFFKNSPLLSAFAYPDGEITYVMALFTPPQEKPASQQGTSVDILLDISASVADYEDDILTIARKITQISKNFNCIAFNDSIFEFFQNTQGIYQKQRIEKFNKFIEKLSPGWGTNLLLALSKEYEKIDAKNNEKRNIVLITDGVPSVGEIGEKEILSIIEKHKKFPVYVIAIGEDVSEGLLKSIAEKTGGEYIRIAPGEDFFKILDRKIIPLITRKPVTVDKISVEGGKIISQFPEKYRFRSGMQGIIPLALKDIDRNATISISISGRENYTAPITIDSSLSFIPRIWAKKRVNYLLRRIADEGEKDRWVDEIVALSKKFTFITPYTAFLAAPRAVLRPRIIQPRDPKIVVDAPDAIQVVVDFPWGEQIIATKNRENNLWEARFFVPQHIEQGEYECTITITGADGTQWQQRQKFIVDTTPPQIKVSIVPDEAKAGQTVELRAYAPQDTRTIIAKTPDGKRLDLRWNGAVGASTAIWKISRKLPAGEYEIKFIATDFAGNQSEQSTKIKIKRSA